MATADALVVQIESIELQLRILKARVQQVGGQDEARFAGVRSFADAFGAFPGPPQATEEDIDAALYTFEWDGERDE